ncbi:hypothetical protein D9758_006051 [Tetrapyrgos nigripes]|uniref:J domain-containing protein n=1 Tax=Tetrapyrgos nigripes TaxID=182062 RepID=A0A8H5FZV3_9AGAR|nr:hypothetical protein D9758_006051 [Tetrapyrgos nigripes]
MAELYDTLGISSNATSEEIRKAYKKRALETHPDRLPPNATAAEKEASGEKFRKVNNAYEVLNDAQNRRLYDRCGVWPPPEQSEFHPRPSHRHHSSSRRHTYHHDQFSDPFFNRGFHFTDPFELFESIFRDMDPSRSSSRRRRPTAWDDPFDDYRPHPMHELNSFMNSMHRNMMSSFGNMGPSPFSAFPANSMGGNGNTNGRGRWNSVSTMSQTINGVTHTVHKRRDWDGNEHVTRVYPDGRQVVTINGVEQPDQGLLLTSHGQDPRHVPPPPVMDYSNNHDRYLPPPPPYSAAAAVGGSGYRDRSAPPMEPNGNYSDHHSHRSHRSHRSSRHHTLDPAMTGDRYNPGPGVPESNMYNNGTLPEAADRSQHKRHWWSRH